MDRFTDDVLRHIFGLLTSPAAQAACSQTCKGWNRLEKEARRNFKLRTCAGILPEQLEAAYPGDWVSFRLVDNAAVAVEPDFKRYSSDSFGHSADLWLALLGSKQGLTSLTLGSVHVTQRALAVFLKRRGATLRHLSLEKVTGVDGGVMDLIAEHCPKLEYLAVNLELGSGFSWATRLALSSSRGALNSLSTSDWNGAPPLLVAPLISAFHNLEFIDLGKIDMWFFQKNGDRIFSAVAGLKKIKSLKLPFGIGQQNLLLFKPLLPQLQKLELFDMEGFISVAPSLSSLVELSTFGALERYRQLGFRCKLLQKLSFQAQDSEALPLEIQGLHFVLAGCKQLEELSLRDLDLGNMQAANEIAAVQDELLKLTTLRLDWHWSCKMGAVARQNACQILGSCSNLTRLELSCASVSRLCVLDQELELISLSCRSLQHLKVERVGASVPGLALIAVNCKGLLSLELVQVAVGDVEIAAIAKHCKGLRRLRLVESKLSKFGVIALAAGLPSLVTLILERKQKHVHHVAGTFRQQQFMQLGHSVKRPYDKVADQFTRARPSWVAESYAGMHKASMVAYPVSMSKGAPRGGASSESWFTDLSRTLVFGPHEAAAARKK